MQTRFAVMASAVVGALCIGPQAVAQTSEEAAKQENAKQLEALKKQVEELKAQVDKLGAQPAAAGEQPAAAKPKGYLQFYGHVDLSFDVANKGIGGRVSLPTGTPGCPDCDGVAAVGASGWYPAIASNSSYIGVRGGHDLGDDWKVLFQIEVQADIAATPGVAATNFHDDAVVRGAVALRDSYGGFAGPLGALKIGKSYGPYYQSTSQLNPFYGTVGTYTSIMGNTGGDNRVEFAYRFSHAVWFESPKVEGLGLSVLFSPGQNLNNDNLIQPLGEPGCTAGYSPTSLQGSLCNDGSFGDAWSTALTFKRGPVYAAAAWEWHKGVNRTVDELFYGGASPDGSIGITNEYAWKVAAQVELPTQTRVGGVYEQMHRTNPYVNQDYNERDRDGFWIVAIQKLGSNDELDLGWGHAGKTPGDVGTRRADGTVAAGPVENAANMYTALIRHSFLDGQPSIYVVYARQVNENGAHYDLGAGNHGLQYDCHDGNTVGVTPSANSGGGGRCWAGSTLQAFSIGMTYNF